MSTFRLFIFSFLLSLSWSCSVDEFDNTDIEQEDIIATVTYVNNIMAKASNNASPEGLVLECITIVYPFSMMGADSTVYEVLDESSFEFINTSTNIQLVDFIYPLTLVDRLGETSEVNNINEFGQIFAACVPFITFGGQYFGAYVISQENSCYELVYPIEVLNIDNNEIATASNEEDFIALLAAGNYAFKFPLKLTQDNQTVVIDSADNLFYTLSNCGGIIVDSTDFSWGTNFQYIGCYEIVFPISINGLDSDSTAIVTNAQSLGDYILHGKLVSYAYPIQLLNENGSSIMVNSEEELSQLINDCYTNPFNPQLVLLLVGTDIFGEEACYELVYPFQLTDSLSVVNIINRQQLVENLEFNNGSYLLYELVFPMSVLFLENQTVIELKDEEDLFETLSLCN